MTLSEAQIDKFWQVPSLHLQLRTARRRPQLLGTLACGFLAAEGFCTARRRVRRERAEPSHWPHCSHLWRRLPVV